MKRHTVRIFCLAGAVALAALGAAACVGGKKGAAAEDKERLKSYILDAPPSDIPHKLDVNFENKIRLIGYRAEPAMAKPGTEVKLTYYWKCEDPLDDGWQLFTHVQADGSERAENLDNVGPLRELKGDRQVLSPDKWERGKVYIDEQSYRVPDTVSGESITVYLGVYKGDTRLKIQSGPNDGGNRAIVATLKTGRPKVEPPKKTEFPVLSVPKMAKGDTIVIDGKSDDKAWGAAASTGPFVDVGTGRASSFPVQGRALLTWDDANLYVFFDVTDPDLNGPFTDPKSQPKEWTATGQPMLWTKDTVELMIDPDGDGDNVNYYELQINPQNKVFHSQFDTKNMPRGSGDFGPFGHEDWDPKLKSAVVVRGTLDNHGDKDQGYTVEAAIPWTAFAKGAKQLPPKHGDAWRMNLYAMQDNGGVSFSPILGQGNFHTAPRFGRMIWVEPGKPLAEGDAGVSDAGAADAASAVSDAGTDGAANERRRDGGHMLRPRMPPVNLVP
jgi:hypothetical protein